MSLNYEPSSEPLHNELWSSCKSPVWSRVAAPGHLVPARSAYPRPPLRRRGEPRSGARASFLRILVYLVLNDSGQVSLEHLLLSRHPSQPTNPASITYRMAPSACAGFPRERDGTPGHLVSARSAYPRPPFRRRREPRSGACARFLRILVFLVVYDSG